jgi:hypothetical protein
MDDERRKKEKEEGVHKHLSRRWVNASRLSLFPTVLSIPLTSATEVAARVHCRREMRRKKKKQRTKERKKLG